MFSDPIDIPIEKIHHPIALEKGISVYVKRDDLIHPEISGNKWRKLKYNLLKAQSLNKELIITMGGAFSNHIAATAALGKARGIRTKGIIRGEEKKELNQTLKRAQENGMELEFISRQLYDERNEEWFKQEVLERHRKAYFIPEGGANFLGMQGCTEILHEVNIDYEFVCICAGTGTTASGLAWSLPEGKKLLVFPALKGGDFLKDEMKEQLYWALLDEDAVEHNMKKVSFHSDYHFGGYAKINQELINFMRDFHDITTIKLDPIYTAKMFFGIFDLIQNGHFKKGQNILLIHSGGLQGISGIESKIGQKIYS